MLRIIRTMEASRISVDPSEIDGNNMKKIKRAASGYFRDKKRDYLSSKRRVRTRTLETCVEE
jgi:hypothetical protein